MTLYYTENKGLIDSFYDEAIHGKAIPKCAKPISKTQHQNLLKQQAKGAILQVKNNQPIAIFESPDLASTKKQALFTINAMIDEAINHITDKYPRAEVDSWPTQEREALVFLSKSAGSTPLIDAISITRNIPKKQVVNRINQKAENYKLFCGKLIGLRHKLEAQIKQAADSKTLEAIDLEQIQQLTQQLKVAQ